MDTPQETRGFSLTLSWNGAGGRRARTLDLGSAFRVAAAASLCGVCFKVGLWAGRLQEASPRPASGVVVVESAASKALPEKTGDAPGGPVGEKDVITPLNVRDPSALVMAPYVPAAPNVETPPSPKTYRRIKDIKPSRRF